MCNPVRIRGVDYPSQKEAAEALGVSPVTVSQMLDMGRPDSIGLGKHKGKPVTIRGVTYANGVEAGEKLGVSRGTIYKAKRRGTLDNVGTRTNKE